MDDDFSACRQPGRGLWLKSNNPCHQLFIAHTPGSVAPILPIPAMCLHQSRDARIVLANGKTFMMERSASSISGVTCGNQTAFSRMTEGIQTSIPGT